MPQSCVIPTHHVQERLEAFIEHVSIPAPLIFGIVQVRRPAAKAIPALPAGVDCLTMQAGLLAVRA